MTTPKTTESQPDLNPDDRLLLRSLKRGDTDMGRDDRYPPHSRYYTKVCGYFNRTVSESQVFRLQDGGYLDGHYKPTQKGLEAIGE